MSVSKDVHCTLYTVHSSVKLKKGARTVSPMFVA